ncbi:spore protease YyaC [Clostridium uliginosum]|uniref:Putative sporulation protein YyaC n=1 Tax=Clostridium uliginosum TaxID=119641 RepID=A0A1I1IEK6_9CLOT|nr:spore protease YyaC [Clostridium uliginosum]SFC32678.1 putative sporulation protein YyaC [Clostridium uliginosum]
MIKHKVNYKSPLACCEISKAVKDYINNETIIVCIGTDKCIGDCLGPLVGSILEDNLFPLPIYGTLSAPIHALNIDNRLNEIYKIHPNSSIIGIDACLGDKDAIGEIHTRDYAIHPGKGVGKELPEVGIASIIGIVDIANSSELFSSYSIRLSLIMDMAKLISKALIEAYNIKQKDYYEN